mmetsp:Transcript_6131/g.14913  ORF Transcript_6131/g.14913 Transcript_6131/m.14913 type:complete len:144 (+) Transcript_6131:377-808(+)
MVDMRVRPGVRVMVFLPLAARKVGRKLLDPWAGPYRVEKMVKPQNIVIRRERGGLLSRVHLNRLRTIGDEVHEEDRGDHAVVFPDTRRLVSGVLGKLFDEQGREEYEVVNDDPRLGFRSVWIAAHDLPPVIRSMVRSVESEVK